MVASASAVLPRHELVPLVLQRHRSMTGCFSTHGLSLAQLQRILILRGGEPAPATAAAVSIAANTLAMMLFSAALQQWKWRWPDLPRWKELALTVLCAFATYYLVFLLCGFVPMGFVPGATPLLRLPTTWRSM